MLEQFLNHIREKNLCTTSDRVLVAVSGGIDSMTLLHLLVRSDIPVGVAHVNFGLRPEAVDEEELVRQTCLALNVPLHVRRFDTRRFAEENRLSIQVAARELRYSFFEDVAVSENYDLVATAHHADDNLETVLLNLVRGTGIDGLTGIPLRQGKIIRPLLFATRAMIEDWARANDVKWLEDASNREDYYARNLIRHQVVPRLKELNPSLENSFARTLERIRGTRDLASNVISDFRSRAIRRTETTITIDREALNLTNYPAVLLWEVVKEWGFSYDQCTDAVAATHSGKFFLSSSHRLALDRNVFMITRNETCGFEDITFSEGDKVVNGAWSSLTVDVIPDTAFVMDRDAMVANLDRDKIAFPLTWRKWREGDVLVPLGMKSRKKVSDLLIDTKVPRPMKDRVTVLESGGAIIWVVGHRIADHVKVTPSTRRILIIRETPSDNDFE